MSIVELDYNDLSLTRSLAEEFFAESKLPGQLNFDHWQRSWSNMIKIGLGSMFVYFKSDEPIGLIGGVCVQCTLTGQFEAIEMFWYVNKEHRGSPAGVKLLLKFEEWAKERNAARVKMMHLSELNPVKVRDVYLRMGYTQLETAYSKELCQQQ